MPEEVIELHRLNQPARPYEAGRWPAIAKRGDEPRALPWAGMKQAVGLKTKPAAGQTHRVAGVCVHMAPHIQEVLQYASPLTSEEFCLAPWPQLGCLFPRHRGGFGVI